MATSYKLYASTPEKIIFEGEIISISLPGGEGYMEVLPDHAAIISLVNEGKVVITPKDQQKIEMDVKSGFFQMNQNQATLLLC